MKKLIIFSLLLMLSISSLSFAQNTPTPEKDRDWIVGIGWRPATFQWDGNVSTKRLHYNATVGYKGFTISYYMVPTDVIRYTGYLSGNRTRLSYEIRDYFTVGYQHVFSKQSNAKVKPIVGFEYGITAYVVNVGVQYKRHQLLMATGTYLDYESRDFPIVVPLLTSDFSHVFTTLKYQFLF